MSLTPMTRRVVPAAVVLILTVGCKKEPAPDHTGDTETHPTTGSTPTSPTGSGECVAPDTLPDPALDVLGDLDVVTGGGPNLVHLVDVEADFDRSLGLATGHGGLMTFDISDPNLPRLIGRSSATTQYHKLVSFDDDRVFVSKQDGGLVLYDISDLTQPQQSREDGRKGMPDQGTE